MSSANGYCRLVSAVRKCVKLAIQTHIRKLINKLNLYVTTQDLKMAGMSPSRNRRYQNDAQNSVQKSTGKF